MVRLQKPERPALGGEATAAAATHSAAVPVEPASPPEMLSEDKAEGVQEGDADADAEWAAMREVIAASEREKERGLRVQSILSTEVCTLLIGLMSGLLIWWRQDRVGDDKCCECGSDSCLGRLNYQRGWFALAAMSEPTPTADPSKTIAALEREMAGCRYAAYEATAAHF